MRYKSAGGSLLLELACFQHKAVLFQVCKLYWNIMLTAYLPDQAKLPRSLNSRASRVWKGHGEWGPQPTLITAAGTDHDKAALPVRCARLCCWER